MVFNKKGISPLIATVLIIGFTVALAAVIMVWGQGFIKGMQTKTQAGADIQLVCAQDVLIAMSDVCRWDHDANPATTDKLKVTLKNDGSKDLKNVTLRFYKSSSDIATTNTLALGSYQVSTVLIGTAGATQFELGLPTGLSLPAELALLRQVEALPIVEIEGKAQPCSQAGVKFPVGLLPDDASGIVACQ